jgi:Ca-activated chloride channel homolog
VLYLGLKLASQPGSRSPEAGVAVASVAPLSVVALASSFHFTRPAWLLAAVPVLALWWVLQGRSDTGRPWRRLIAPHLLQHLWGGAAGASRINGPVVGIGLAWLLVILAIAGPAWRHVPSPFADDTAALAVVIEVSPSMQTQDVEPTRLQRAILKIHDLLQARGRAGTSLIAYAGSAHLVMPVTRDGGIIDTFAQALDPRIMPVEGDAAAAALALADRSLARAGGGSIVWMTDGVAAEQAPALARWRQASATALRLWPPLLPGEELNDLRVNADPAKATLVRLAADDSDVESLARAARFADVRGNDTDTRWAEDGYWLTPLIALLLLPLFRRGWMVDLAGSRS